MNKRKLAVLAYLFAPSTALAGAMIPIETQATAPNAAPAQVLVNKTIAGNPVSDSFARCQ